MQRLPSKFRRKGSAGLLLAALVATSGLSAAQAQTSATATAGWTTVGSRVRLSAPSVPITSHAGANWTSSYDPPRQYPNTSTLPVQYLTMADGVRLSLQVTLPADASGQPIPGRLPVIVQESDYNPSIGALLASLLEPIVPDLSWIPSLIGSYDPYIVKHGYANVSVDARGTGNSGGVWKAFDPAHEADDNRRILDWAAAQSWSNGKIGLFGISDVGIHAINMATLGHPAVKALYAAGSAGDTYRDVVMTGGQGNLLFMSLWYSLTTLINVLNPQVFTDPLTAIPVTLEHLSNALFQFQLPSFVGAVLGDPILDYDGDFWAGRSPSEQATAIKVPTFLVTSAHDIWQRGMPLMYEVIKRNAPAKLLVGSMGHSQTLLNLGVTGDGVPLLDRIQLRWFDQYVKGLAVGADSLPNVTQNVLGYGHMAFSTDWPHPQASARRFYLHGDASLSTKAPGGLLDWTAPRKLIQQPFSGLCSISASQWTLGSLGFIPLPCFSTDNTTELFNLVYETPLLGQDMYFNGPMQADIWVSTTNGGGAVSVRIDDVDLFGIATPISNGLLDDRYQQVDLTRSRSLDGQMIQPWHSFTQASAQTVVPGQPMKLSVDIFPGSALLRAGHRLRVAIGPSNIAQGFPLGSQIPLQTPIGTMTVYNDAAHPSSVVLPIVPASVLPDR